MISFRVPHGCYTVITHYVCSCFSVTRKRSDVIRLRRSSRKINVPDFYVTNGALANVIEWDGVASLTGIVGFTPTVYPELYPGPILLTGGDYCFTVFDAFAAVYYLYVLGYTFRMDGLMNPSQLWNPDTSCQPFQLSSVGPFAGPSLHFTVPCGELAVITSLLFSTSKPTYSKSTARWSLISGSDTNTIPVHGALLNVEELDELGVNYPGFVPLQYSLHLPVRILLRPGDYQWLYYQLLADDGGACIAMHGYTFPDPTNA